MRNIRFASILLTSAVLIAAPLEAASAQTFPQPPDVTYTGVIEPVYASGTVADNVGPTTEVANTMALPDQPTLVPSNWTISGTFNDANGFKAIPPGSERKFRTHVEITDVAQNDPMRNFCQPGQSHWHMFFGADDVPACATFSVLRKNSDKARSGGGSLNGTAYWSPLMIVHDAWGDGRTYGILADVATIYYEEGATAPPTIRLPLGMRYVAGYNMDQGDAFMQAKINVANAQPGTAGRYQLSNGTDKGSWTKFVCQSTGQKVSSLATAVGGDPFSPTCPSTSKIDIEFHGARCWDRTNTWTPGGYSHLIPEVWDTVKNKFTCGTNFSRVAALRVKLSYTHEGAFGPRGYTKWRLSSDPIAKGAYSGTLHGQTILPGQTFHADWFGAWDLFTFNSWQDNCLGGNGATPHECDNGVFSATTRLKTNDPGPTRNPQVCLGCVAGTATRAKMIALPASSFGDGHKLHAVTNKLRLTSQGDSLQQNANGGPERYKVNNGTVTVTNRAVGGTMLNQNANNVVSMQAAVIADNPKLVTIGIGTNDLPTANITAWLASYDSYVSALRAQGIKVAVSAIPPKVHPTDQAGFDSARATVHTWFKAGVGVRYDAFIDYTQSTCFDESADAASLTCYTSDGIHPNSTGYAAMATIYEDVVDSLLAM